MKIYAISDLHISGNGSKPMDVFGGKWVGYLPKIAKDWQEKVNDEDVVLIGGDVSWAMDLPEAVEDINGFFGALKGKKVFVRGNHDYWWKSISRVRSSFHDGYYFLQNDCVKFGNKIICGSRGWSVEGSPDFKESDRKIYYREAERLKLAFHNVGKVREDGDEVICVVHYPPFNARRENSLFTELFEQNGVDKVVYGHLHGKESRIDLKIVRNGIEYFLTSCDQVDNKLTQISEV